MVLKKIKPTSSKTVIPSWLQWRASRSKATLLAFIMLGSFLGSVALPVLQTSNASAVTLASTKSGDTTWQVQSFLYQRAIARCLTAAKLHDSSSILEVFNEINKESIASGLWFSSNGTAAPPPEITALGTFMKDATGSDTMDVGTDGFVNCDNAALVSSALNHWGLDAVDVLCNSDFRRRDLGPNQSVLVCKAGATALERKGSREDSAKAFYEYISKTVYGDASATPELTNPELYIFYRHTLSQSCIPGIDTTKPRTLTLTADNQYGYSDVSWVDTSTLAEGPPKVGSNIIKGSYIGTGSLKNSDSLGVNPGPGPQYLSQTLTCAQVAERMSTKAPFYQAWADINIAEAIKDSDLIDGGGTVQPTCGSTVTGMGWIICPLVDGITGLNDAMWGLVSGLLTVDALTVTGSSADIYAAWTTIRNIANILFVVVFLFMIFSQLTGAGVSNYGVKKIIPRLVIGAILVNVSFVIVQLGVDLANIFGSGLYSLLTAITPESSAVTWEAAVQLILTGATTAVATVGVIGFVGGPMAAFWLILPMAAMGALGLLAAVLTLVFRQAIIPILAILAPLAFVAYLLPNTESWYKKWQGLLISMLMLYPLAALLFGGVNFVAVILVGDGTNFGAMLTGLIVMTLPLFALPFLARQTGPIVSKVGGALSGLASKARNPLTGYSKDRGGLAKKAYMARPGGLNFGKKLSNRMSRNAQVRKLKGSAYDSQDAEEFNGYVASNAESITGGVTGSAAKSHIGATVANVENAQMKEALTPLVRKLAGMSTGDKKKELAQAIKSGGPHAAAALQYSASIGDDSFMREQINKADADIASGSAEDQKKGATLRRQAFEAIGANNSTFLSKAPDLVKGASAAFSSVKGADLAGFSKTTAEQYMKHIGSLSGPEQAQAITSFNSAVEDITRNSDLQSKFSGDTGSELRKHAAQLPQGVQNTMFGTAAIMGDGKIR
jgi:hypothetical protein